MFADETELFICRKKNFLPFAKNVLLTVDNPGAYNVLSPIIRALADDDRCANIGVISSGVASKKFGIDFRNRFTRVIKSKSLVIKEIATTFDKPDIIICSVSEANGPEGIMLYAGKSVFGAEKLYMVCDGWGTLGSAFGDNRENMDTIDGFFCNDLFAWMILKRHLPKTRNSCTYAIGTPVIETIEVQKADKYRKTMRKRFGLDEETRVLLFLGDISDGYKKTFDSDPRINEITFEKTAIEMMAIAEAHPNKKFALVLRPHPRDTNKQEMYAIIERLSLPQNLIFIDAGAAVVQMNEAAYGADVIASIASTENFLAPLRGRRAVYLGYEGAGLGGELLNKVYGREIVDFLSQTRGVSVAASSEEFSTVFLGDYLPVVKSAAYGGSVARILNIIF